jgi:aminoglycoside 6'-N-acetyltransferase I
MLGGYRMVPDASARLAVRLSACPEDVLRYREQIGALLCDFRPSAENRWDSLGEALAEVDASVNKDVDRISVVALTEPGIAVGWVAGFRTYAAAFELHPLVVHPDWQGRGLGQQLLAEFERRASALGALTVYLGSDDTAGRTSLGSRPLFPGVLANASELRNLRQHPYEFYLRCGYEVVGVFPDVNGPGKPDIWLAKAVGRRE